MGLYYRSFIRCKPPRLIKYLIRYIYLADIMQQRDIIYQLHVSCRQLQLLGKLLRIIGHSDGMSLCIRILGIYEIREGLHRLDDYVLVLLALLFDGRKPDLHDECRDQIYAKGYRQEQIEPEQSVVSHMIYRTEIKYDT